MNSKPIASIIIPVLNGEKMIGEAIVALKGQAGVPGGFEIIVVDNGSTDRTVEIAKSHGVILLHQPKRGPAAARNLGLAHSQGDIIVCIDSDCIASRRLVSVMVATMADPEVGIGTGPVHSWQPITPAELYLSTRNSTGRSSTTEHPRHAFAFGMHTTFRRKEGIELGGWDEAMGSGEDMDFCLRHRKRYGKPIRYVDEAILFHKHRATDEAFVKQSHWHGAGFALVQQRHPEVATWLTVPLVYCSFVIVYGAVPIIWLGHKTGLISPERVKFEGYHRLWVRHYWGGYLEEKRNLRK